MAERLKDRFGPAVPRRIAGMIAQAYPAFPARAFVRDALDGFEALELMARAGRIAQALHRHLPPQYPRAVGLLIDSLGPPLDRTEGSGMAPFLYLPHVLFVGRHGLDHFEPSMRAQYELTQRFTAEFSIRAYLERHPQATLARLAEWASDPSVHVRRLVSEGTRPRLPWAPRLRAFQRDPRPVLALLERLRDDPASYVRRSVANNLNDIGKDHPGLLIETARRWLRGADGARQALLRHALRSLVKQGDREALTLLGCGETAQVEVRNVRVVPRTVRIGGRAAIAFDLANEGSRPQRWQVDLRVHYVKADGSRRPKVFRLRTCEVPRGASVHFERSLDFAQLSTRKHHPGVHTLEVAVNGAAHRLGDLVVRRD